MAQKRETYHGGNEIKSSHPDTDVLVVYAGEDGVLILADKIRMRWDNFDHREESDVLYCIVVLVVILYAI